MLAFYSDDPSSNPADAYSFSVQIVFEKNENVYKEAEVGPFKKKTFEALKALLGNAWLKILPYVYFIDICYSPKRFIA